MRLKSFIREALFTGAAFKDLRDGSVHGPDGTHASVIWGMAGGDGSREAAIWDDLDNGDLVAGFLTTDMRFLTRKEAGRYVGMEKDERRGQLDTDDGDFQNNVDSTMWESAGSERIIGAAYLHVPTGYITPPAPIHSMAMFDPGLQNAARKSKMDPDRFVARYLMDRVGDSRFDGYEFVTGFVSDQGKFYDRKEATAIAKANPRQPAFNANNGYDQLDSTDLHWQKESRMVERAMAGAAIRDIETGMVYGPNATHHDVRTSDEMITDFHHDGMKNDGEDYLDLLWDYMNTGRLLDGFLSDDGHFFTREAAAKAIRLDPTQGDAGAGRDPSRNWLDSMDLDYVDSTIHEAAMTSYSGYAIDDAVRDKLIERFPPMFDRVSAHHITYEYGVGQSLPPSAKVAKIIATVSNDRAQALIVEINGSTSRPNGQTYHITLSYAAAQGATAKDSNAAITESPWEPLEKPLTIPVTPRWFGNEKPAVAVPEDVDSDVQQSRFLITMSNTIQRKFRAHLDQPIWDAKKRFITMDGARVAYFAGQDFGLPGEFAKLYIVMRQVGNKPDAAFHAYEHGDTEETERIVSFAVLPSEDDVPDEGERLDVALSRMVTDYWGSIMLHELQHVTQDIQQIPMDGKGSYVDGTPDANDYFNKPAEFDAYYHQIARDYHAILISAKTQPEFSKQMLAQKGFDRDFRKSLEKMLPTNVEDHGWGIWYYARQQQNRRLTKRLYALHQAIVAEMDRQGIK